MIAIYARQSIDKKDSVSIETQIEFCKKEFYFEKEKYKIYTDKGFSGKNIDRPAFSELLQHIENGEVSKVVVYRLDRISRSITDFSNIMDLLEENSVSFVSSTEKFDTSTPMGRAMLYIVMVFAQLERETIAERVKDNYYSRGKTGVFLGGPAPIGYTNTKVVLNGKNACILSSTDDIKIVKELFDIYANTNRSLGDIAKEFKAKYGDKYGVWNNIKLSRILHNPVYVKANADIYRHYKSLKCILVNDIEEYAGNKACHIFGKRDRGANKYRNLSEHVVSLAQHDGIVDADTFLRCQYKLQKNTQIKNTGKGKHTWLTGIGKCGKCGYSLVTKICNEKRYFYCSGRQNNACYGKSNRILVQDIEDYVANEIVMLIKNDKNEVLEKDSAVSSRQNDLKIELYKIEEQINNLIDSMTKGNDTLIEYINGRIVELDSQKAEIEKELQDTILSNQTIPMPKLYDWLNGDVKVKSDIAQSLISKVLVIGNQIEIVWKH